MKNLLCLSMYLATYLCGYAQEFSEKFVVALPDTVEYERLDWIDADNDGLLDLLLSSRNGASEAVLFLYSNDTINGFAYLGHIETGMVASAFLALNRRVELVIYYQE